MVGRRWWGWKSRQSCVGLSSRRRAGLADEAGRAGQAAGSVESHRGSSVDRGRRKDAWPCAGLFTRVWSAAWAPTSEQSERRRAGAKKRQDRRPELGPSRSNPWKMAENQEEFGSAFGDLPAMEQGCVRAASSCSQTFAAHSCESLALSRSAGQRAG